MSLAQPSAISLDAVNGTIDSFTELDAAGDKRSMTELARRIGKEQPALLAFAAQAKAAGGDALGEAAIFYGTLVWAMFDRALGKKLPRLLPANLTDATKIYEEEIVSVETVAEMPVHERVAPGIKTRQPDLVAKLQELVAEDVKESALASDAAEAIFRLTQIVVEAFDGAVSLRRPGQNLAPVVREEPKVGRNDVCPCGSGKKYKRCHGSA